MPTPSGCSWPSNNKYIVCGWGPGFTQFITRLNYNGSVDNTFGTNGFYLDSTVQAHITDMFVDASENIYAVFLKYSSPLDTLNYADNYVVKLNANGSLSNTFGAGGKKMINIGNDEVPSAIVDQTGWQGSDHRNSQAITRHRLW